MTRFIPINFKALLRHLHIAEHYDFFEHSIIARLSTLMTAVTALTGIFNVLKETFLREDAYYKQSLASALTAEIANLHEQRIAGFNFFWTYAGMFKYWGDAAKILAAEKLQFLYKTYKSLPRQSYQDASGMMTNFLQDCNVNEWKQYIQALGLTFILDKIMEANTAFKDLYVDRAVDKEHIADIGKAVEIRTGVDDAFESLVDAINVAWRTNEVDAKDPALRAKLIEIRELINASIHQAQTTLTRRGHHKPKDDDNTDEGTQTPITPPTPPTPGTQQPNTDLPDAPPTEQNPSDGPHHLDPNEHPAMGE
ncbi:MAG: DUF6261 family protein [Tannerellaceae bacterium]|jgi:hypothetical protein|nr:DUF6261 family protein [Tannerellaceae bacterium]